MSDNNWETQPRKKNGEFTFRHGHGIAQHAIEKTIAKLKHDEIRKFTRGGSYGYLRKFTAGNKSMKFIICLQQVFLHCLDGKVLV